MSELFEEDDDEKVSTEEDGIEQAEDPSLDSLPLRTSDARRRLERMLEEKRLRDELEDFLDF